MVNGQMSGKVPLGGGRRFLFIYRPEARMSAQMESFDDLSLTIGVDRGILKTTPWVSSRGI